MSLFRRDNKSIKFDVVGLSDNELEEITELIQQNGGEVGHDDMQPIKFTKPFQFVTSAYPTARLYDTEFIRACVTENEVVDPARYRIGTSMLYDDCVMAHFLGGSCGCSRSHASSTKMTEVKVEIRRSDSESDGNNVNTPRPTKRRRVMETTENSGNQCRPKVTSPTKASYPNPEVKTEPAATPIRKSRDEENVKPVARENRSRNDQAAPTKGRRRGRGVSFTATEEMKMVNYLIDNRVISDAGIGLTVWQTMIDAGICSHRTANSLYTHFKNSILPNIDCYGIAEKPLNKFKKIKNMT